MVAPISTSLGENIQDYFISDARSRIFLRWTRENPAINNQLFPLLAYPKDIADDELGSIKLDDLKAAGFSNKEDFLTIWKVARGAIQGDVDERVLSKMRMNLYKIRVVTSLNPPEAASDDQSDAVSAAAASSSQPASDEVGDLADTDDSKRSSEQEILDLLDSNEAPARLTETIEAIRRVAGLSFMEFFAIWGEAEAEATKRVGATTTVDSDIWGFFLKNMRHELFKEKIRIFKESAQD